jgi:hypothetical protein
VTAGAPGERQTLFAGPLALDLDDGGLRYVRLGEREVLRRVYVAVRDGNWVTAPMTVVEQQVQAGEDSFAVDLVAEHRLGSAHFRWKGSIRGDARGVLRFEMDGEALTTFQRNRIGICVLHPMETCAGQPCRLRHPDGTIEDLAFPRLVSPHQPFFGVRALSYEVEPGVVAEVEVEGEVFETEDQRNWSDNSFKTYSTPMELPKPVEVAAGTRIRQAVTVRLVPQALARRSSSGTASSAVSLAFTGESAPLPALGTTLAPRREPLTARELVRLSALNLSRLRVELVPSREDFAETLAGARAAATALSVPLEVGLWVSDAPRAELELFAADARREWLAAVQLLPLSHESSAPDSIEALRALLPGVTIAAGSAVYFTELNRNRAPAAVADALMYPNAPTVHMIDDTTVAENVGALPAIAETTRSFFPKGGPLSLSPVGLRKPPAPPPRWGGEPYADPALPRWVDVRQSSLFLAGWTAAHLASAARAGFASVTYFQTTGWRGLMAGDVGPALPPSFAAQVGTVFPAYHVLADLAALRGGQVLGLRSSTPMDVNGLCVRQGGRTRALVANLTGLPQVVTLPAELVGGRLRRLDETIVALAMQQPESFRDAPPLHAAGKSLIMGPHELALIDVGD